MWAISATTSPVVNSPLEGTSCWWNPPAAARAVADDLGFPNGSVVTAGATELIVAESSAGRLTAFSIADDGSLHSRRVFADLDGGVADGICLDAEGAVWFADPLGCEVVRVADGGRVLHRISTGTEGAFACTLGGDDGRTLFVCTYSEAASMDPAGPPVGRIVTTRVDCALRWLALTNRPKRPSGQESEPGPYG